MRIFKARTVKKAPIHPRPKRLHRRWLLWTGLFSLLLGAGITYVLYLDTAMIGREQYMRFTMLLTIVFSGISFISAAADWFIER